MRSVPVILEGPDPNWSAFIPDLPGCVATGDTMEETLSLLRQGIAFHLEGMEEDGDEIPEVFREEFSLDVQIAAP